MSMKPIVQCRDAWILKDFVGNGSQRMFCKPINHPDTVNVSNTKEVVTSRILERYSRDGKDYVETQNTIYEVENWV